MKLDNLFGSFSFINVKTYSSLFIKKVYTLNKTLIIEEIIKIHLY